MPSLEKRGCDHIFFVGFLGAGKSTLARNLGHMFNRRYVDTDRLVERRAGKTVTQIFESDGEASFRILETKVLESLSSCRSLLVSCGAASWKRRVISSSFTSWVIASTLTVISMTP